MTRGEWVLAFRRHAAFPARKTLEGFDLPPSRRPSARSSCIWRSLPGLPSTPTCRSLGDSASPSPAWAALSDSLRCMEPLGSVERFSP